MKKLTILFSLLISVATVFAQQRITVSGNVTEAATGNPIPGVTVLVKGTTTGTVTNVDGQYTIDATGDAVLTFRFVGMESQDIAVNNRTNIDVSMQPSTQQVDEVVVVGYGKLNVKDLTSSIATVKSGDLAKTPTGQTMQALQGKVAGLQVVSTGSPGESPAIRLRGVGSYPKKDANGNPINNEAPLYVVDGMFFDNIDFLNTSDIAFVTVLKDASAAAIYGVRAANGVVLIETKSGQYNQKAQITYDGYYGYQIAQNVLQMANAEQFTTMAMESGSAPDIQNILNAMQRYGRSRVNPNVPDVNTDWYKEVMRQAPIQNHSLNISGGSKDASYAIGSSYFSQQGILDMKNEYERFNLRSKIDYKATDWLTVGANMIFSNATRYLPNDDAWSQAYWAVPILPVYDPANTDAWPIDYAAAQDIGYRGGQNPFPSLTFTNNRHKIRKTLTNFYAQINIIPDKLTFKTTYNLSYSTIEQRDVALPYFINNNFKRPNATLTKQNGTYFNQIWDNVLTYTGHIGKHHLVAMAGTSYRDESYQMLKAQGINFPIDQQQAWYIHQSDKAVLPTDQVDDDGLRQYGMSYFGRISYNFNDRYLLYGTMRADGSSKYQQTWGYFPTVGAGWVISEESFMQGITFLNYLKLRGSWGQLGNDNIPPSDGAITTNVVTTAINGQEVSGTQTTSTYSTLKWELTEETNVGITARFLDSRLSLDADYFIRDTKNAAIDVKIPTLGGTIIRNVGVIRNSGFELALDWNDKITNDLSYSISANISTLKNEVRDLYGQPYIDGGSAEFRQRSIVGEPLMAFFGYEVLGVYQNDADIQNDPAAVGTIDATGASIVPGDFKYKDQNGDNIINDDDRVVLGSYFPNLMYGANLGITYKNLQFSTSIVGQSGNKILNRKRGEVIWTPDLNMDADLAKNRWHGEGTSNKYPSSAGLRKGWNQKMSTYFVEDGSFFRIQNVQLAYTIKGKEVFGTKMPETRISLTADRPLTLFNYNGFTPEVQDGIDRQTYPIPAVYTVGLNVKF